MSKNSKVSLSRLLRVGNFPETKDKAASESRVKELQLRMLRIQQGVWHQRRRAVLVFEGFDAAGKGGTIRRLVEPLDPRGFHVHPIGPPTADDQGKHYLYRFWTKLPSPGTIAIFDRSWYGRVLVERVEGLTPKDRWKQAYREIREFEKTLEDDGVDIIKIFLAISKDEQLRRFEERLADPYKQWKLTPGDVESRRKWNAYVDAVDDMLRETSTSRSPWSLVPANCKHYAREEALREVTKALRKYGNWMESKVMKEHALSLEKALKSLGVPRRSIR